ncbi:MAG TPA: type IV pilin-like G/H family protein, partial [Leptolyngbya sp.]|nr:type IV pilin-like G/H family protein [Leptolyngbya sp.]
QDVPEVKQQEAEAYLKAMLAAQENFYRQHGRFARSLEELERSTNLISQSYSYAYRLQVGTDSVITAVSRETDLKSYVGSVIVTPSGTLSALCQSLKPSVQAPAKPKLAKTSQKLVCPARSQKL